MPWGIGRMEFWNNGFGGMRSVLINSSDQKLRSGHHPLLYPRFHYSAKASLRAHHSIIPLVIQRLTSPPEGDFKGWSSEPELFSNCNDILR
jgi:hypothetical protein